MRKQRYGRFVVSRSKPSKKWDCTSASKNLPPHQRRHQGRWASVPTATPACPAHDSSPKPMSCCQEGEPVREACSRVIPSLGSQASGTLRI